MCNLGKMIARENIEKRISTRTKKKNILNHKKWHKVKYFMLFL